MLAAEDAAAAWVSYAALAISIAAILVSTWWGIYTWRRSGEMLTVSGDIRAPLFQSPRRRAVRVGEIHSVLTISARNRGRAPVRVHRLYLASRNTKKRSGVQLAEGSPERLPVTIDARDRVRWFVAPETLGVLAKSHGNPLVVRPLIEYGPSVWKRGRLLRIRVGQQYLPGNAPPFRSTLGYRVRTLRRKKGVGPYECQAGEITLSSGPPPSASVDGS
jgi:hypothetical protein